MLFRKIFKALTQPSIKKLSRQCERLAEGPKNSTNIEKRTRVREVLKIKNDIMNKLQLDFGSSLKQKITKQAIELVIEYLHLIEIYYEKAANIDDKKIEQLQKRIAENNQKLSKSEGEDVELRDIIEVDERLLLNSKCEKEELEKINSKLNYMESSIVLFSHQLKDDIYLEEISDNVNSIINEAIALDNVINQKKRDKNKI